MSKVTVIPPTKNPLTHIPTVATHKRRVAGYARVSTDSEEQQTSYASQVKFYTAYIQSKPEWQFVSVYTDDGVSALNTKHRDGFNQMITDALDGKIDLIVTKSVSRFARNTVDSLSTVRKLKENGTEVYFEKDYIKKRPYTKYGRFSCDNMLYIVFSCCILTLDIVRCRLLVA